MKVDNKILLLDEISKLEDIFSTSFSSKAEICKVIGNRKITWEIDLDSDDFKKNLEALLLDIRSNNESSASVEVDLRFYELSEDKHKSP